MPQPHLLMLSGVGGPPPRISAPRISRHAQISWIYIPDHLFNAARDVPLMREHGSVHPVSTYEEAAAQGIRIAEETRVDGVLTFSDNMLMPAARIAEAVGLRHNSPSSVSLLTNKLRQREALVAGGIPVPAFFGIAGAADLGPASSHVGFPAVLKPVGGGGSILATLVRSHEELVRAWGHAEAALRDPALDGELLFDDGGPLLILERLLVGGDWHDGNQLGDYVSVESSAYGGVIQHLGVMDKLPLAEGFRETGHVIPSVLSESQLADLHDTTDQVLRALGVTEGMTHTELKLTAEGPRVIEVNGRVSGGGWGMFDAAADFDVLGAAARTAVGLGPVSPPRFTGYGGFLTPRLGAEFSRRKIRTTVAEGFATRRGVTLFDPIEVTYFDVALGEGTAAMAFVSGDSADAIVEHSVVLNECIGVELNE